MNLNPEWYNQVLDALRSFADKDYQERAWIKGQGEEISTFIEASCQLFDDTALTDFLEDTNKIVVSAECDNILREIGSLIETIDEGLRPVDIVNHNNMIIIRKLSKKAISLIETKMSSLKGEKPHT